MTVYEIAGEESSSSTRGSPSRATSTSASISSCPTWATWWVAGSRGRADARPRGPRRRAAVPLLREVDVPTIVATRLTLGLVKSKLDEHGSSRPPSCSSRRRATSRSSSGRFRLEARPGRPLDPRLGGARDRDGRGARRAHRGLEARPHTRGRAQDGRWQAGGGREPRGGPAPRRLDQCRAARGTRDRSDSSGRRSGTLFPPPPRKILVASFASNIHRMQQAADVAIESGRKVTVIGRSMRKNSTSRATSGTSTSPSTRS